MTSLKRSEIKQRKIVAKILAKLKRVENEKASLVGKLTVGQSTQINRALDACMELERSLLREYASEAQILHAMRSELGLTVRQ